MWAVGLIWLFALVFGTLGVILIWTDVEKRHSASWRSPVGLLWLAVALGLYVLAAFVLRLP